MRVFDVSEGGVAWIAAFWDPDLDLFAAFGLPPVYPEN